MYTNANTLKKYIEMFNKKGRQFWHHQIWKNVHQILRKCPPKWSTKFGGNVHQNGPPNFEETPPNFEEPSTKMVHQISRKRPPNFEETPTKFRGNVHQIWRKRPPNLEEPSTKFRRNLHQI